MSASHGPVAEENIVLPIYRGFCNGLVLVHDFSMGACVTQLFVV